VRTKVGVFAIFSLFVLMMAPAHASVTSMSLEKSFYTNDESFKLIGTQDGKEVVFIIIRDASGDFKGMLSDPRQYQGEFSAIPRPVSDFFENDGIYNATAFTGDQKEEEGFTIKLEFNGKKVFEVPDFVLQLKTIADKLVEVEKTISFTVSLTDSSIEGAVFSLEKNPPIGATIDPSSGKFVWTVSKSQGNIQDVPYEFDIVVNRGAQEDRETITITIKQAYVEPEKQPEPKELGIASFVDESKDPQSYVDRYNNEASYRIWFNDTFPEYDSIYQAVGLEKPLEIPASFVDELKDPQSYVDRYNSEAIYKKWFDDNYSEYSSIYEAVGLEEPKELAPFVDKSKDPQSYVDRYNNEDNYKEWFDKTYPEMTIYEAVGLEEPKEKEKEFGTCGEGTRLIDGVCTIFEESEFGECGEGTELIGKECTIIGKSNVKPWWQFW